MIICPVSNHCPIHRHRLNLSLFLVVPYTWNDTATLPTPNNYQSFDGLYYVSKVPWLLSYLHPLIRTSQRFRSFYPYSPGNSIYLHIETRSSINSLTLLPFLAIVRSLQCVRFFSLF